MTTPHRTLQMALDALDAITDDVDGTGLNTMPSFDKALDAIAALREALNAPEPEPVARCILDNGDEMGSVEWLVRPRSIRLDHGSLLYAAPPAAPEPSVDDMPGMWEPSDTFGGEADSAAPPAAPAPAAPVPDGWVMVPREPTQAMCAAAVVFANGNAVYKNVLPEVLKLEEEIYGEVWSAMIAASPAAPAAPVVREPRRVRKVGGSFQHTGAVVAEFKTTAGEPRIVIEFDAPVAGMLHVYRPDQVEPCEPVAPAAPPAAPAPAQPVPLTQDQIADCTRTAHRACDAKGPMTRWSTEFARAIEAAHGITGGKP